MMKKTLLLLVLLLSSCGIIKPPWGDAEIPVAKIHARATEVIQALANADLNKDGVIKGDAEWYALGSATVNLVLQWVEQAKEVQ